MCPVITLLTDFGTKDVYVGVMKGVILGIAPDVRLVDLAHDVPPQSIRDAAFLLMSAIPYFPPGTIHLVVVDPGVGGTRRPVAVKTGRAFYVAPDNGVLSVALANDPPQEIVELTNPRYRLHPVSSTFHGRDIFAPAAAHLARGVPIGELGSSLERLYGSVSFPHPVWREDGTLAGVVVHVDRFGNCITNIPAAAVQRLGPEMHFQVGATRIGTLSETYCDTQVGKPLALIGSAGYLEIAVREGNAAKLLGLEVESPVLCIGSRPPSTTGKEA